MLEWLKRRAWKARIRLKRIRGSNPLLSAKINPERLHNDVQPFLFAGRMENPFSGQAGNFICRRRGTGHKKRQMVVQRSDVSRIYRNSLLLGIFHPRKELFKRDMIEFTEF